MFYAHLKITSAYNKERLEWRKIMKIIIFCLLFCSLSCWGSPTKEKAEADINDEVQSSDEPIAPNENTEHIETSNAIITAENKNEKDLVGKTNGLIEINYNPEPMVTYRERRGKWSGIYAIEVTSILPQKFRSLIDTQSYSDIFSEKKIPIPELILGVKYNLGIGGLTADLSYGQGLIKVDKEEVTRSLNLTKQAVALGYVMDSIFFEPYFAPYVRVQMYKYDYEETFADKKIKKTTTPASAATIGLLFQLNWLEKQLAYESLLNHELNNTFLDIFATQYNSSTDSNEPRLETGLDVGAGIKLEF